ncbi:hypothetical protein DFJ73DRAFT_631127, partial [Zopfochytrium polystomum]
PAPPSLYILPDIVTGPEELLLLDKVNSATLSKWTTLRNRRLQTWGGKVRSYNEPMLPEPLPSWLDPFLTDRLAGLFVFDAIAPPSKGSSGAKFNHCLVNEYLPGQGIMPHEDGPAYLPIVATVSLGSHTVLTFSPHRGRDDILETTDTCTIGPNGCVFLPRRSLVVVTQDLYERFLHGIDEIEEDVLDLARGTANGVPLWNPTMVREWADDGAWVVKRGTRVSLTNRIVKRVAKLKLFRR